ncbi:MAG: hypothetical protein AAGM33_05110, partial [Pseudomonadota bacterium]
MDFRENRDSETGYNGGDMSDSEMGAEVLVKTAEDNIGEESSGPVKEPEAAPKVKSKKAEAEAAAAKKN